MHPFFKQLQDTLGAAVKDLDERQTQLHPVNHPEKWSSQQVIEHLLLTYSSTRHALEVRLAKGTPTQVRPSLKQRLGQFVVLDCGLFPKGRPAPEMVSPPASSEPLNGEQLTVKIHQELDALDALLDQVQTRYGNRRSVTHRILGPLRPDQWRKFHLVHALHHARQIAALRGDRKM